MITLEFDENGVCALRAHTRQEARVGDRWRYLDGLGGDFTVAAIEQSPYAPGQWNLYCEADDMAGYMPYPVFSGLVENGKIVREVNS